jgi:hypothetical protein
MGQRGNRNIKQESWHQMGRPSNIYSSRRDPDQNDPPSFRLVRQQTRASVSEMVRRTESVATASDVVQGDEYVDLNDDDDDPPDDPP